MNFDYYCQNCGDKTDTQKITSMLCVCGGSYRPDGALFGSAAVFDAYFDPTLKKYVSSYREQEKEGRKFKTPEHPDGLTLINDNKKFIREMKYVKKHKEDYKAATSPGYKPGDKYYNPNRPDAMRPRKLYFY